MSSVHWAVRRDDDRLPSWVMFQGKRWTTDRRDAAYHEAARWESGRVVKITRKPKVKAAQREAWEGRVCLSPSGFHSSKLIGVTDVVSRLSLRLSATPNDTRVRVTFEVLP